MSSMDSSVEEETQTAEEQGTTPLELVREDTSEAGVHAEKVDDEENFIFDITRPELIDAMVKAADALESVAKGTMTISEALSLYTLELEQLLAESKKPVKKRKTKKQAKPRKAQSKTKSSAKKSKAEAKKSASKSKKSKSKRKNAQNQA